MTDVAQYLFIIMLLIFDMQRTRQIRDIREREGRMLNVMEGMQGLISSLQNRVYKIVDETPAVINKYEEDGPGSIN